MNDLRELMRENVASPPPDRLDVDGLLSAGRRRVRTRRTLAGGVAVLATAAVLGSIALWPGGSSHTTAADQVPTPDAPTIRLSDAQQAVEGTDYRVLASYTNDDLNADNGQYFDGVTDDGMVLFRDGPREGQLFPRYALMDPATGEKDWLPRLRVGQDQTWAVSLGADQLVLVTGKYDFSDSADGMSAGLVAHVFDRATREWHDISWPALPAVDVPWGALGPDGRLYVKVPAAQGQVPEGGWPTGPDGEAEDADAEGDSYSLWSVSLTDAADARDEHLAVGDFAFNETSLVWTDRRNGDAGMVHVRDLATGQEHSFDPHTGARCNLLTFGVSGDRVMMSQYCGTYQVGDGEVRDDRVQILTTDGDQVVTLQDDGVEGYLAGAGGPGNQVVVSSYSRQHGGTYVYDLEAERFLRLSDAFSSWANGGPTPDGQFIWNTPVNHRQGSTQWLGKLLH